MTRSEEGRRLPQPLKFILAALHEAATWIKDRGRGAAGGIGALGPWVVGFVGGLLAVLRPAEAWRAKLHRALSKISAQRLAGVVRELVKVEGYTRVAD